MNAIELDVHTNSAQSVHEFSAKTVAAGTLEGFLARINFMLAGNADTSHNDHFVVTEITEMRYLSSRVCVLTPPVTVVMV